MLLLIPRILHMAVFLYGICSIRDLEFARFLDLRNVLTGESYQKFLLSLRYIYTTDLHLAGVYGGLLHCLLIWIWILRSYL